MSLALQRFVEVVKLDIMSSDLVRNNWAPNRLRIGSLRELWSTDSASEGAHVDPFALAEYPIVVPWPLHMVQLCGACEEDGPVSGMLYRTRGSVGAWVM